MGTPKKGKAPAKGKGKGKGKGTGKGKGKGKGKAKAKAKTGGKENVSERQGTGKRVMSKETIEDDVPSWSYEDDKDPLVDTLSHPRLDTSRRDVSYQHR